jgi:hypothetical protein
MLSTSNERTSATGSQEDLNDRNMAQARNRTPPPLPPVPQPETSAQNSVKTPVIQSAQNVADSSPLSISIPSIDSHQAFKFVPIPGIDITPNVVDSNMKPKKSNVDQKPTSASRAGSGGKVKVYDATKSEAVTAATLLLNEGKIDAADFYKILENDKRHFEIESQRTKRPTDFTIACDFATQAIPLTQRHKKSRRSLRMPSPPKASAVTAKASAASSTSTSNSRAEGTAAEWTKSQKSPDEKPAERKVRLSLSREPAPYAQANFRPSPFSVTETKPLRNHSKSSAQATARSHTATESVREPPIPPPVPIRAPAPYSMHAPPPKDSFRREAVQNTTSNSAASRPAKGQESAPAATAKQAMGSTDSPARKSAPYPSAGVGTKECFSGATRPSKAKTSSGAAPAASMHTQEHTESAWRAHVRSRPAAPKVLPFVKALSNVFQSRREMVKKTCEWGKWQDQDSICITDASSFGMVVVPSFTKFKSLGAFVRELTKVLYI